MANFDPNERYSWPFTAWQGNYIGPTDDALLDSTVVFNLSLIANPYRPAAISTCTTTDQASHSTSSTHRCQSRLDPPK